jgi:hypothetical protein
MTWAQEQRLLWIKESVEIFGRINRAHVMQKFRVSENQAAIDFRITLKKYPKLMEYNTSTKQYEKL